MLAKYGAIAFATIALAMSSCGSSSKTTTASRSTDSSAIASTPQPEPAPAVPVATGRPLARAQWVTEGDSVCAGLLRQLSAESAGTRPQLVLALTQTSAYERAALTRLAVLVPPRSKKKDWEQYLTGLQHIATSTQAQVAEARAGTFQIDSPAVLAAQSLKERIDALVKSDGFAKCSRL